MRELYFQENANSESIIIYNLVYTGVPTKRRGCNSIQAHQFITNKEKVLQHNTFCSFLLHPHFYPVSSQIWQLWDLVDESSGRQGRQHCYEGRRWRGPLLEWWAGFVSLCTYVVSLNARLMMARSSFLIMKCRGFLSVRLFLRVPSCFLIETKLYNTSSAFFSFLQLHAPGMRLNRKYVFAFLILQIPYTSASSASASQHFPPL